MSATPERYEVTVSIVNAPDDGKPAVLLQLPFGYLIMKNPGQITEIGRSLIDAAAELP